MSPQGVVSPCGLAFCSIYSKSRICTIVWHLNTADDIDTVITAVQVEGLTDTYYLKLRDRDTYLTADGTAPVSYTHLDVYKRQY